MRHHDTTRPARPDPAPPAGGTAGGWRAELNWRDRAACLSVDPEMFFPTAETGSVHDGQVAAAKQVCARCPVVADCRAWAVEALPVGVAGGLDEQERRAVRAARPSGPSRPSGRSGGGARLVVPPVGGTRREFAAAGRAAVAAGESVASVAARFGVDERTVYHWRASAGARVTSDRTADRTSASAPVSVGGAR